MPRFQACIVLGVLAGVLASGEVGAAELKVAVINMDRVLRAHPDTKANRAVLEQQIAAFEEEQKAMVEEREKLKKTFEDAREQARNDALSEAARQKARGLAEGTLAKLREQERDFQETLALRQKNFSDQRLKMRRRVVEKLREVIRAYCEREKITVALDGGNLGLHGAETVIYCEPALDVTDAIIGLIGGKPGETEATDEIDGEIDR